MHKDKFTEISHGLLALAVVGMVFWSAPALAEGQGSVAAQGSRADITESDSFVDRLLSFGIDRNRDRRVALPPAKTSPASPVVRPQTDRPALRAAPLSDRQKREPLPERDARLYRGIFELQDKGAWDAADQLIAQLRDERLVGYVLAQRYLHPTAYKAGYEELREWMAVCADYPMARKIYRLALARKKRADEGALRKPETSRGLKIVPVAAPDEGPDGRIADIRLQSKARSAGQDRLVDDLARQPPDRSGAHAPQASWVAGMAAWRRADYKAAAKAFEATSASSEASAWTRAAGAFWASRAHMRAGNFSQVSLWLEKAAQNPRTFYGLIATRALGRDFDFDWSVRFSDEDFVRLAAFPQGVRAMALARAGRTEWAEAELRAIESGEDEAMRDSILAFAASVRIPALAMELVSALPAQNRAGYDAALYPLGDWMPKDGYRVDPALVHAIIRQESRFDPQARSHKGATGLMQLMPATARGVIRQAGIDAPGGLAELKDPLRNLEIGQQYIADLIDQRLVGQDLFSLAIAYNAGPGNLARWKARLKHVSDPLLFIESIPVPETRAYVEKVLANYWIYRLRMGEDSPSLDAVAAGQWAHEEDLALVPIRTASSGFSLWE
jgi:soluble lytic murein transglycosylase